VSGAFGASRGSHRRISAHITGGLGTVLHGKAPVGDQFGTTSALVLHPLGAHVGTMSAITDAARQGLVSSRRAPAYGANAARCSPAPSAAVASCAGKTPQAPDYTLRRKEAGIAVLWEPRPQIHPRSRLGCFCPRAISASCEPGQHRFGKPTEDVPACGEQSSIVPQSLAFGWTAMLTRDEPCWALARRLVGNRAAASRRGRDSQLAGLAAKRRPFAKAPSAFSRVGSYEPLSRPAVSATEALARKRHTGLLRRWEGQGRTGLRDSTAGL
jgi:hypothetical protein